MIICEADVHHKSYKNAEVTLFMRDIQFKLPKRSMIDFNEAPKNCKISSERNQIDAEVIGGSCPTTEHNERICKIIVR